MKKTRQWQSYRLRSVVVPVSCSPVVVIVVVLL